MCHWCQLKTQIAYLLGFHTRMEMNSNFYLLVAEIICKFCFSPIYYQPE